MWNSGPFLEDILDELLNTTISNPYGDTKYGFIVYAYKSGQVRYSYDFSEYNFSHVSTITMILSASMYVNSSVKYNIFGTNYTVATNDTQTITINNVKDITNKICSMKVGYESNAPGGAFCGANVSSYTLLEWRNQK